MIYIIGDDTGNNNHKYYVSYMIYEEGIEWLRQNIQLAVGAVENILGEFPRFHFRELINLFKVGKVSSFNTNHGKLYNSKESVLEGVVSTFVDLFSKLVENQVIFPQVVVSKLFYNTWQEELDKGLLFSRINSKEEETLLPLLNAHKCIKLLRANNIDEDFCCLSDLSGTNDKVVKHKTSLIGHKEISINCQSAKKEPLLQMADFLAYSYNRLKTCSPNDMFNSYTKNIIKYYSEL